MDNKKKIDKNIECLKECIDYLNVDMPLYLNNQKRAIRFDFERYNDEITEVVIKEILLLLFEDSFFWLCEYGSDSPKTFCERELIKNINDNVLVIPYISHFVDPEDFEYPNNTIACVYVNLSEFSLESYVKYVMSSDFISNTIFLIDPKRYIAVNIYDRRGMDITTVNKRILKELYEKYTKYVSEYYFDNISGMINCG